MKLTLPLYRHFKLYSNYKEFQKNKFIDQSEYRKYIELKREIERKQHEAESELNYEYQYDCDIHNDNHSDLCCEPADQEERYIYDFKNRYGNFKHSGIFYNNISYIYDILKTSECKEEFYIKCTTLGIEESFINYVICYIFINPERFFNVDWGKLLNNFGKNIKNIQQNFSFHDIKEINRYYIVKEIYFDIIKGNKKICNYDNFKKEKI